MPTNHFRKSILSLAFIASGFILSPNIHAASSGLALDTARGLAYSALAGGVVVLDVADSSNPTLVSQSIQTQGVVQDVFYQASKQLLYIAAEDGDLEIWDLQDPALPQQLSVTKVYYFDLETPVLSVAVVGNIARVTTGWDTFHSFDVTNPSQPVATGFSRNSLTQEIELGNDGQLYRAGQSTLRMTVDADGEITSSTGNQYLTSYQIAADNGYAYASYNNTLQIIASESGLPFVYNLATGNNIKDIFVSNDIVYIATGTALTLWDVSNKSAPIKVATEDSMSTSNVVVSGDYAYLRNGSVNFRIVDISIASNPIVVGQFSADGSTGGSGGEVTNIAPIADAGTSQGVKARSRGVTLDGTKSYDLDGTIASYSWTQTSGKSVSLSSANTATPTFRAPGTKRKVKTLEFKLSVTDNDGASASSTVQISVYPK